MTLLRSRLNKGPAQIYGLIGPEEKIRYVGQTILPISKRLRMHRNTARSGRDIPVSGWMRTVGLESVEIVVLEKTTVPNRLAREKYWITALRTSVADGGLNYKPVRTARSKN